MKHIAIVTQYYYPENFRITDIAEDLVKRGYKVTVITGIPNYPDGKFFEGYGLFKRRSEERNGVSIIRLPIISRGRSKIRLILNYYSFVVSGWFFKLFTSLKANIVYTHEVSPMMQAFVGKWLAQKLKVPSILCVQDLWPESVESTVGITNSTLLKHLTKQSVNLYESYSKILVSSNGYIAAIMKHGIPEDKIIYWPQYAEDFYRPSNVKSNLIPQDGKLNITFTGNVGVAQGLDILPLAAKELARLGYLHRVRFNIVGDGRFKCQLEEMSQYFFHVDIFRFIQRQDAETIPDLLAASDVAFLSFAPKPLFSLILPAKLQSYLACGIPIIASADGESAKLIEMANAGLVSEVGNHFMLATNIIRFINMSADDLQIFRTNALKFSENNFDKTRLLNQLSSIIDVL